MPQPRIRPEEARIAVLGLGYVGLPLAAEFGRHNTTMGFDIDAARIAELNAGTDRTGELTTADLAEADRLAFTDTLAGISDCNVYIVAVPTPIDAHRQPDLAALTRASELVGQVIGEGDVVIFESTVYPGATEDDCLPVVERASGLTFNRDFFAGYSPERINPGDTDRPITRIVKVTSGSTPETADFVDALYARIIAAGTHRAPSIRVAEAAKIIENTQRDLNIALVNELSILFSHLDIDTHAVLDAAATKWNFTRMSPGLVGGHCIGVDPYYLVHKSLSVGHVPDIIRGGREINDGMARHAAARLVKAMIRAGLTVGGARILILGATFKENCADLRNTKIGDLAAALADYTATVEVHDPWAGPAEAKAELGMALRASPPENGTYAAVVLAVPHADFVADGPAPLRAFLAPGGVFFDMKSVFTESDSDLRL